MLCNKYKTLGTEVRKKKHIMVEDCCLVIFLLNKLKNRSPRMVIETNAFVLNISWLRINT